MSSIFRKLQEKPESIPEQSSSQRYNWGVGPSLTPPSSASPINKLMGPLDTGSVNNSERQNSSQRALETYKPFFLEYSLMGEYVLLHKQHISGAYILPSAGSPLKWFGVLFIRQGLYQGGIFRFTLYIPDNFPDCDSPILVFEPQIFHPLINIETGELDVKRSFPKWREQTFPSGISKPLSIQGSYRRHSCHLWQVILFAKRIFLKIETQSPLNQEAALLYEKDLELYKLKVAENMNLCHEHLYEKPMTEDNHAIWFCHWNPTQHEELRQKLLSQKTKSQTNQEDNSEYRAGLSWIQKGSSAVFSKKEL